MNFYSVSHFIQVWLLPPGFNLLLALIGFILVHRWMWLGITLMALSFISLWLLSTPIFSQLLIDNLQNQYSLLSNQEKKFQKDNKHGVIIVLGGGFMQDAEPDKRYVVNDITHRRLHYSVYLSKQTNLPIIVSGGSLNNETTDTEADLMNNELRERYDIQTPWNENKSITTHDEAKLLLPMLQQRDIKTAYIVTDAWHMPRAMYAFDSTFKNKNITLIPAPMGFITIQSRNYLCYLPSLYGLTQSLSALHEYIGLIEYHFIYYFQKF